MTLPFNLKEWINENRHLLKPPIGNKNLFTKAGDFIVMVVGGPNARKDYHYNESEELFYQIEGDIIIRVQIDGKKQEIILKEGEIFLLPAKIPHSPVRGENSIGLVIEKVRKGTNLIDGLNWYCEKCNSLLKSYEFPLENIEKDFLPKFKEFYGSQDMRTCNSCGHIMEVDEKFI